MMSIPDDLKPRKLSDEILDRLQRLIRDEGLVPGDALPSERDLMARYGVGRPAVREAIQTLQHRGVVEIRHGGRARLAAPSLDGLVEQMQTSMRHLLLHGGAELDHLKEARAALEVEMARLAATRRTDEDLKDLRALLDAQRRVGPSDEGFTDLDGGFHRRIAAISGNPIFEAVVHGIFGWMRAFHTEAVRAEGLESLTLDEHQSILDAIAAGDPDAAAQAMRDHLERANALYHRDHAK